MYSSIIVQLSFYGHSLSCSFASHCSFKLNLTFFYQPQYETTCLKEQERERKEDLRVIIALGPASGSVGAGLESASELQPRKGKKIRWKPQIEKWAATSRLSAILESA